jgi:hypothetical protein
MLSEATLLESRADKLEQDNRRLKLTMAISGRIAEMAGL